MAVVVAASGCSHGKPPNVVTPGHVDDVATKTSLSVDDVCGRKPANLKGNLSSASSEDIKLFVANDGSDTTSRHVRESLSKEALPCQALSYRACEAAVTSGADQGLALEAHRMAMNASACKQPTPGAVAANPNPSTRPVPKAAGKLPPWRPGKFMVQAFSRVSAAAQRAQQTTAYGFESNGAAVLGAFLKRGHTISMARPLEGGVKYIIIGGGSDSVTDLDLEVVDSNGRRVGHDTGPDAIPIADFKAPQDGEYTINLRLSGSKALGSFTAITIMRASDGYNVPVKNLASSFGSALALAAIANDKVVKKGAGSLVYHADGDWCVYGVVLKQSQSITFHGVDVNNPTSLIVGGTDGTATDFDLRALDASKGVIASDTGSDNTPMLLFQPASGDSYAIEASTERSPGPSLVTVMVLDVVK